MIAGEDLLNLLKLSERLKTAQFDQAMFIQQKQQTSPQLTNKLAQMSKAATEMIESFDITGDKLISPEEFFNIIMFAYGY